MPNHKLEITLRGSGRNRRGVIVPGHCRVAVSDSVTWEALDTDAVLFFPNRRLFGRRDVDISAGNSQTLTSQEGDPVYESWKEQACEHLEALSEEHDITAEKLRSSLLPIQMSQHESG